MTVAVKERHQWRLSCQILHSCPKRSGPVLVVDLMGPDLRHFRSLTWQMIALSLLFCSALLFCHLCKWDRPWRSPKCDKASAKGGVGEKALNELLDQLKPWHVPLPSCLLSVRLNIKGADKGATASLAVVGGGDTTPKHGGWRCCRYSRQRNGTGASAAAVKIRPQ